MGKEEIVARILADAEEEAAEIVRLAEARAEESVRAANARAEEERAEAEEELSALTRHILEVNAAAARLDGAKIALAEKRRVIETVYARAKERLLALNERDSLAFLERLLLANAEEGDEIVFDESFAYAAGAARLPVVKERKLTVCATREKLGGGCILRGRKCDKDLSYPALLAADMEEHQAEIAAKLFQD